jgi:hypothetical protein
MAADHSDPQARRTPRRRGARYAPDARVLSDRGHPRARAVVWGAALPSGGLLMILLFFVMIDVVDFMTAPHLVVIGLAWDLLLRHEDLLRPLGAHR